MYGAQFVYIIVLVFALGMIYYTRMPRVARKKKTLLDSSSFRWSVGVSGVVALGFVGAYFLGNADKGMIDVTGKIRAVDQTALVNPVNPNTAASQPNGGLIPTNEVPAQPPPPVETETSTTTEDEVASENAETQGATEGSGNAEEVSVENTDAVAQ